MKEDFLHYLWHNKLFYTKEYKNSLGETVAIIDTGIPNFNAGPDFFNGKIKSGNTIWAGNIEIHLKASDWNKHGHQNDPAYNNVILHVVSQSDEICRNASGQLIPAIEIEFPDYIFANYSELIHTIHTIPCGNKLKSIGRSHVSMWIETMAIERIQKKTEHIENILLSTNNNWEESFYQFLARSFGFGVNSDPFEQLAKSIPLKILTKHKSNLNDIEALLFGQSGILDYNETRSPYVTLLTNNYRHLKTKYSLQSLDPYTWKFLRLRPVNFPTIRIAQFSSLVFNTSNLFSQIIEAVNIQDLFSLFNVQPSAFWKNHYHFNKESKSTLKSMGNNSIQSVLINAVIPLVYMYGSKMGIDHIKNRAVDWLNELKPENNAIIRNWTNLGIGCRNSFESQGLIQLKKEYCDARKCLQCNIGNLVINQK